MPQDHPRTENQRAEQLRGESARLRSEKPSTVNAPNGPFGEVGANSVQAGLRMQSEMFNVLQDIGHEWFARATSEAELAFELPNKLTSARSVSDALSAYQEWLGDWMNLFGENSRRFVSDSRKIMDTGVRCLADASSRAPR